jgi:hypothetical protein
VPVLICAPVVHVPIEEFLSSLLSLDFQRTILYNDIVDQLTPQIFPTHGLRPTVGSEGIAAG